MLLTLAAVAVAPASAGAAAPGAVGSLAPADDAAWLQSLAPVWRRLLQDLNDWALPRHEALHAAGLALAQGLTQACAGGSADLPLTTLRRQWRETQLAWRRLEALQLGPTLQRRTSKSLDFWPTRPPAIEQAARHLAQVPLDGPQAEQAELRWGSATRGLPALEWLLYADDPAAPLPLRDPLLCRHAVRSARALVNEAELLRQAWQRQGQSWAGASPAQLHHACRDVVNLVIGSIELLRGKKLQKGVRLVHLGGAEGRAVMAFDAVRSGQTHAFLMAHVEGLAQVLLGRSAAPRWLAEGPASGLVDLFPPLGLAAQAPGLRRAVRDVHEACASLPADPRRWTAALVDRPAARLQALRDQIDPGLARALRMRVSFTDADGD